MKDIILTLLFTAVLGAGLGSCAALEGFFGEGTVFTTADQLEEGQEDGTIMPDSPAERELEETLAEIEEGKSAMYDAWEFLYNINMTYDLDKPGKVLTERAEDS